MNPLHAAMPILIINMGGEMMYILEQRLRAQHIVKEKSAQVLRDVIRTMFMETFVAELFRPQPMHSIEQTRAVFDRLAHASIMRLNKSSMDKLYDLMTMGCKYQIMSCASPDQMLQVTLNHLDALTALIKGSTASPLVALCTRKFLQTYKDFTKSQWRRLRQALCSFFQDRKVKVSLFLADGIQFTDGTIIISHGGVLPEHGQTPGTIKYYDEDGTVRNEDHVQTVNNTRCKEPTGGDPFSQDRPVTLGRNLYSKDRVKTGGNKAANSPLKSVSNSEDYEPDAQAAVKASTELNSLARLMGQGKKANTGKFDLNLFPGQDNDDDLNSSNTNESSFIKFDLDDVKTSNPKNTLKAELDGWGDEATEDAPVDDLLSMMDAL
jgi:hypothetical protein